MSTKMAGMTDSARQIENLIYRYSELIDAGDLDGVAALFTHGRICGVENGPPETVFDGAVRVREMYDMATRLYDDGTPKTKHLTSNVQIYVDDSSGTAESRSYYSVTQATPELPLQVIITGHYRDTFHRVDGQWWFDSRTMFIDQVGDVSHHLKW
jgi:3-phenylpropionate/cinnamic acid dioxygenase small subunit